jgi:histidine triad (HIT) family protein
MLSIFSKIIVGEIPSFRVLEDEEFLAILDINPLVIGHVLVIYKIEIDYIFDLDDDVLGRMLVFSKKVSAIIKSKIECEKIGLSIIGLEVPHVHIHLVPISSADDLNFTRPKLKLSLDQLQETHRLLRE